MHSEPSEIAEIFLQQFTRVSSTSNYLEPFASLKGPVELFIDKTIDSQIKLNVYPYLNVPFSLKELDDALKACKYRSAPGQDNIPNKVLKNLPYFTRKLILDLFNRVWESHNIPVDWKTAITSPLLKVGKDSSDPASYRPIALTSSMGKLLERMVTTRLNWFL